MPVELSIVESVTTLDTTVVEVILESASEPGPAGPGVPAGGTTGQVLKKASNADLDTSWQDESGGGVTDHGALTGLADDDHTQYHNDARGDARYSQLGHAHAGEDITTGTVADARIASTIARDSEVTAAISAHEAAADPHVGYQRESEKGVANGYASLDVGGTVPDAQIPAAITRDSEAVLDGDAAGGVLSGTYPNPGFAADMVTQAELDAHEADTTSVHGIADTSALYRTGGTDVALADGGTGASLVDPNADRILFWDDSAGAVTWLEAGTNLTITDTTISASGGGGAAADDENLILHMEVFA